MQLLITSYPTLAVSAIYCIWQTYWRARRLHEQILRERVTQMLWAAAGEIQ
jgi:hypothetical protein